MAATNRSKAIHRARRLELDTGYPKEFNTADYGAIQGARTRRTDRSPVKQTLGDKIIVPGEGMLRKAFDTATDEANMGKHRARSRPPKRG